MARVGSIGTGHDDDLNGAGTIVNLDAGIVGVTSLLLLGLFFQGCGLAAAINKLGIHPIGPLSGDRLADQHLHARGNLTSGAHGINLLKVALKMSGGRLLLADPKVRPRRMDRRGVGLPQNSRSASRADHVQGDHHTAAVHGVRLTSAEPIVPEASLLGAGTLRAAHGEAVVEETGVIGSLGGGIFLLEKLLVFRSRPGLLEEAGRYHAGIISTLEIICLAA
mmetsp:Transcript_13958/g.30326  ORF Transcript_13958/g.30326 Transcript_13958/m.30326 type:complete len:222 (-) Transcript_13958:12-677(-)